MRITSISALVIGILALLLALSNRLVANEAAEKASAKREALLVANILPEAQQIAAELLATNSPYATKPETIEQLLFPFKTIVESLGK